MMQQEGLQQQMMQEEGLQQQMMQQQMMQQQQQMHQPPGGPQGPPGPPGPGGHPGAPSIAEVRLSARQPMTSTLRAPPPDDTMLQARKNKTDLVRL